MEKRRLIKPAIIYGVVWLACLVLYWGSLATGTLGGGGIMGYVILALYIALPSRNRLGVSDWPRG